MNGVKRMNKTELAKVMAILRANYPNVKIEKPEAMINAWLMTLGEFSTEAVMKAAEVHMATSKFFPTPAELRKAITHHRIMLAPPKVTALPPTEADKAREDYYLEELCKFVGIGQDPDNNADLTLENFLPYEQ